MIHQQVLPLPLLQRLLRGLPHEIDMQQHAQAAHKFHLHSGLAGSAPLTVCRATIGCSQKANKQFNSMRSRGRERDGNNSVWHVAKVIGCATLMPSCNVAVNHRADTATDNRTQSCLSVFSQSPPPPPPQLQVVVGGAAETMRESTFKVNWASRLLGRKWKWKWRILDYSLFVFFFATSSSDSSSSASASLSFRFRLKDRRTGRTCWQFV